MNVVLKCWNKWWNVESSGFLGELVLVGGDGIFCLHVFGGLFFFFFAYAIVSRERERR